MFDITDIIITIVTIIIGIVTYYAIPYIKNKMTVDGFNMLQTVVNATVVAAEVIIKGEGRGAEKFSYVLRHIKNFCEKHKFTFDEQEIRDLIENAWYTLISTTDYEIIDEAKVEKYETEK